MIIHCSKGERDVRPGMRWRDLMTDSLWEIVEPSNLRIYSPSGFGGTPCFWCKAISLTPTAQRWMKDARADGCVEFCGDSIASMLVDNAAV